MYVVTQGQSSSTFLMLNNPDSHVREKSTRSMHLDTPRHEGECGGSRACEKDCDGEAEDSPPQCLKQIFTVGSHRLFCASIS